VRETASAGKADCHRCQVAKPASWLWLDVGRKSSRRRARAATAQRGAGGRTRVATMTAAQVGWCAGDGCTHDDCLPFRFDLSFPSFLILSLKMHGRGAERRTVCDMTHASSIPPSFFNSGNAHRHVSSIHLILSTHASPFPPSFLIPKRRPRRFLLPFNSDDARRGQSDARNKCRTKILFSCKEVTPTFI